MHRDTIALALFGLLSGFVGAATSSAVPHPTAASTDERRRLLSEIEGILKRTQRARELDSGDPAMMLDPSLRVLFKSPGANRRGVEALLSDPNVGLEIKKVGVRSMECLTIHEHVEFLKFIFGEVKASRCDSEILSLAIYPGSYWGSAVVDNYKDPGVRSVLLDIAASPVVDQSLRETIESVLDGSHARFVEYLRGGSPGTGPPGSPVPFIACDRDP